MKSKTLLCKDPASRWILLGIPVIFIFGSLMHFVYEWSGNLAVVGIFAPVNESVWEHLKMAFWPTLLWWGIGYVILSKKNSIPADLWLVSCSVSALISPLVITAFFYTYRGALGVEILVLDILSLLLGLTVGQLMALHIYHYAKLKPYSVYIALAALILMAAAFAVFTFFPPHIPLFQDANTGAYGI